LRLYNNNLPPVRTMDLYKTYRMSSARLANWDYGSNGVYFVTICTAGRKHYFGTIQDHVPVYTRIGEIACQYWLNIPLHFPFVVVDYFVVMPNHLHGLVFIDRPDYHGWSPNRFGPQSKNLASIVRGYKAGVKSYATQHQIEFAWQARYYDRVVRNEEEWKRIRQYIADNPLKWEQDRDNPENLYM
jgi:putative transposase